MELTNTLPNIRLQITGSVEPLAEPVQDTLHRWSFPYRQSGLYLPEGGRTWEPRLLVYAQRREHVPLLQASCRFLLRCFEFALTYLQRDHPLVHDRVLHLYLCTDGKPGAEQQRNSLYLYAIDPNLPPQEWARELAHEYGHAIVPPINSFKEPEAWANGDLGERLFLSWMLEAVQQKRLTADDGMGASAADLQRYIARSVEPLIRRMEKEGLNPTRWKSRRRDGFEEYLALALYAGQVYGRERLARAMLIAGGVEPDDFLNGLRECLLEQTVFEAQLQHSPAWLFLPKGIQRWRIDSPRNTSLKPDPKRPEWARISAVGKVRIVKREI
jgi:hypothetical protein